MPQWVPCHAHVREVVEARRASAKLGVVGWNDQDIDVAAARTGLTDHQLSHCIKTYRKVPPNHQDACVAAREQAKSSHTYMGYLGGVETLRSGWKHHYVEKV